jgi:hypothetical protein
MSSAALITTQPAVIRSESFLPVVPWRDPYTVSPAELSHYIQRLEQACLEQPYSADLRTCLGMAYAVNFDVYKSLDALEAATSLDRNHFWAQLKLAELYYRIRALTRAEDETLKAATLATNPLQLAMARKQLQEIRKLQHECVRNVTFDKPLIAPTLVFLGMMVVISVVMLWK